MTEWQPIETAPKDGTEIVLCRGDRVSCGRWFDAVYPKEPIIVDGEYYGMEETGEVIDACWMSIDGGFSEEDPPTHWMPLPEPPK